MKKIIGIGGLIFFLAFLAPAHLGASGGAQRVVFSGTIDLEAEGDEVRENFDDLGRRRVSHFKVFSIPDLTMDDPPAATLYYRKRTDLSPLVHINAGEFLMYNDQVVNFGVPDATILIFDEGRILVRYRFERFDPDGTLSFISYGLDGSGGRGDFRLVVIR